MGSFSYICKESNKSIKWKNGKGDACYMFLLKDGKIIEEMFGNYNLYGAVEGHQWKMDWDEIVDMHFNDDETSGIAVIRANEWRDNEPTTISRNDPDQACGRPTNAAPVRNPYHKVY